MIEALLTLLPSDWERYVEVAVTRPVRGVIDVVLARPAAGRIVSLEAHSEIRRLEQQLRWATEKSDALPSSALWPALIGNSTAPPAISRILLLRSTSATRMLAREFGSTLAAAYPADPRDLWAALLDPRLPWPGNGILWVAVNGTDTTVLRGRPRAFQPLGPAHRWRLGVVDFTLGDVRGPPRACETTDSLVRGPTTAPRVRLGRNWRL
ncbi:MAG TPA: hypothetical protein VFO05_12545 [Candidatus Limnocylindrales bacterium]|nr:hypothetical protein [Candidatus Limnocylindrales bacterium]